MLDIAIWSRDNPNVDAYMTSHPRVWTYIANRDIKEGEELLENYDVLADNFIECTKNIGIRKLG